MGVPIYGWKTANFRTRVKYIQGNPVIETLEQVYDSYPNHQCCNPEFTCHTDLTTNRSHSLTQQYDLPRTSRYYRLGFSSSVGSIFCFLRPSVGRNLARTKAFFIDAERRRAEILNESVFKQLLNVEEDREYRVLHFLVVKFEIERYENKEEPVLHKLEVESLPHLSQAEDYLKKKFRDVYAEWNLAKQLRDEYNQSLGNIFILLQLHVRNQMKRVYPMLVERGSKSPPLNNYDGLGLAYACFDAIIAFQDAKLGLMVPNPNGRNTPRWNLRRSELDSHGVFEIFVEDGPDLIKTDKEEYYDTDSLQTVLETVAEEPAVKQAFEDLSQTYMNVRDILRSTFRQKLRPVTETIELM